LSVKSYGAPTRAELCGEKAACGKVGSLKTWLLRNEPKLKTCVCERIDRNERGLQLWRANFYLGSFWKTNPPGHHKRGGRKGLTLNIQHQTLNVQMGMEGKTTASEAFATGLRRVACRQTPLRPTRLPRSGEESARRRGTQCEDAEMTASGALALQFRTRRS